MMRPADWRAIESQAEAIWAGIWLVLIETSCPVFMRPSVVFVTA